MKFSKMSSETVERGSNKFNKYKTPDLLTPSYKKMKSSKDCLSTPNKEIFPPPKSK